MELAVLKEEKESKKNDEICLFMNKNRVGDGGVKSGQEGDFKTTTELNNDFLVAAQCFLNI